MKSNDLFILGSFVVGVTIRVPRWPVPGETLLGDCFDMGPGGKGSNQAIAAKRQGASVKLLVAFGDDLFGGVARDLYVDEEIDRSLVKIFPKANTGCGTVMLNSSGENMIALYPGANLLLTPENIMEVEEDIANSRVLLCQCETRLDTITAALQAGRKHGCLTILNPAPAPDLPKNLYPSIDLITPNETEARYLLQASDDASDVSLVTQFHHLGVKTVVMTRGAKGAIVSDSKGVRTIPTPQIVAVDPTGAGDTFNGVLATCLARGMELDRAVSRASHAGAWCAKHLGVIPGIPNVEQLNRFIQEVS